MKKTAYPSGWRKDGIDKVTGRSRYVDDMVLPGMLHGATVRSPAAHGKISKIIFPESMDWNEFTIVMARDIPGTNFFKMIGSDQPILADSQVNHPGEPVALLAHPDRRRLLKALKEIHVEIDPLPAVFSLEDSLAKKEIIWGEDNILKSFHIEKGDVDRIFSRPGITIVEGEYRTGHQEHLYLEPNGMLAAANEKEGITIWGSLQCPFYVHRTLKQVFNLPDNKVRVIQAETGGAFGGKEEFPSVIAAHAALLAWKSGHPVKVIYDRQEDMAFTTKRHPSRTRHRTAVSPEGKILAMDIEFIIDGGAYQTMSPVVLSRGTLHATGPYFCDHVRVVSRAVATNTPPNGAFRGFGAPQSTFAIERHLEKIARTLGLSSETIRRQNFLRPGQTTATRQKITEAVDFPALLDLVLKKTNYAKKLKQFAAKNKKSKIKKGLGLASFWHGAGFTGSGEKYLASEAGVEATAEGKIRVLAASTELGQGSRTIFAQIAAQALGLKYEDIEVAVADTRFVPNSGPTVASRTTMIVGGLVEKACLGLKARLTAQHLLDKTWSRSEFKKACRAYQEKFGSLQFQARYRPPKGIEWDDEKYTGEAYPTFSWAVYAAEVEVDTVTYETRVVDVVATQEVGKVINPLLATGQIQGGVAQGIGFALYEKPVYREGKMVNAQMTNYTIPSAADIHSIRVYFEEKNRLYGPGGAKGIGELPMDGTAAAVINAVENALGKAPSFIPMLPEDLLACLEETT